MSVLSARRMPAAGLMAFLGMVQAEETTSVEFYASLRTQVESVRANHSAFMHSYSGVRDAFSRVGIKASHHLDGNSQLFAQIEVPVDIANVALRDPYDQGGSGQSSGQHLRLALAGLKSDAGQLMIGQQWLPYYNAVVAPVDMFSSYYSGFSTYTVFRIADTVAYYSPTRHGFSFATSWSSADGNHRSTSRIDARRIQLTGSYTAGHSQLSIGMDDRGEDGYGRNRLYGISASHTAGPFYIALKYEYFDTGNKTPGSFASDGNQAINLFGSYTAGKNTYKLMLADVEAYGGHVLHLGIDHQYNPSLKLFAEFYREDETATITVRRGGLSDYDARIGGGRALLAGMRYDF